MQITSQLFPILHIGGRDMGVQQGIRVQQQIWVIRGLRVTV